MSTYYARMNTAAHNISNAKTEGYSRQEVLQQAKDALSLNSSYGMVGAGVIATDIVNSRDIYYDYKYRKSNAVFNRYETLDHYMENISDYLYTKDSEAGGITNALNDFFAVVSQQTTDAADTTIRQEIAGKADSLMSFIREAADNLQKSQKEINTSIKSTVDQINSCAQQIAALNQQINTLEVYGGTANDLRDQRAAVLDELSALVDVEVVNDTPEEGHGVEEFLVFIGGGVLVDTYNFNQLLIAPRETRDVQTDCEGLYDIEWSNGQDFNIRSTILGGQLQALFELRDGNNAENFRATLTEYEMGSGEDDPGKITLKASPDDPFCSSNAWDLSRLNIPESDGVLNIYDYEYQYDSFEVSVSADGTYTYTFTLKEPMDSGEAAHLDLAMDMGKTSSTVGDIVDFRGIPYYMSQLNEFVRTFSAHFNMVQNGGYDLYDEKGCDVFDFSPNAGDGIHNMTELLYDSTERCFYRNGVALQGLEGEDVVFTFQSTAPVVIEDDLESQGDEEEEGEPIPTYSYYSMTALNVKVSENVMGDVKKLALSMKENDGVASYENLTRMSALREDDSMFKQGIPTDFLAIMVASVGVDGARVEDCAANSENILNAVENRRLSKSGVDEDEEGQDMIELQQLLNVQYRVISVMNEVLNKMINEMGA